MTVKFLSVRIYNELKCTEFIANVFAFGYYFQTLSDCLCTVQSADDSDICLHLC